MKKFIQLNKKSSMPDKLIDFREVTSLTWVTVNYLELKKYSETERGTNTGKQSCLETTMNEYVKSYL